MTRASLFLIVIVILIVIGRICDPLTYPFERLASPTAYSKAASSGITLAAALQSRLFWSAPSEGRHGFSLACWQRASSAFPLPVNESPMRPLRVVSINNQPITAHALQDQAIRITTSKTASQPCHTPVADRHAQGPTRAGAPRAGARFSCFIKSSGWCIFAPFGSFYLRGSLLLEQRVESICVR